MEQDTIQCKILIILFLLIKIFKIFNFFLYRFLRWAISVYSRSGKAAYDAMKTIMHLPLISTLKSYINESEQHSGWRDKTGFQILESLTANNI